MRELNRYSADDRIALVKGDGGSYIVEMYVKDQLVETKIFKEHTLRIVENYAKNWVSENK